MRPARHQLAAQPTNKNAMLIKEPDDHSDELAELEYLSQSSNVQAAKRAKEALRVRRAGLQGERETIYHVNFHFGESKRWAVIHDLRLEHEGRVAQIDHLVMNRALDLYVLESKHFRAGLKITEEGEFLRWNDFKRTFEGMPSPLEQNNRHIAVLKDVLKTLDLPTRAGIRLMPALHSFVLVSPSSRIDRPKDFDSSHVIKADTIKSAILDAIEGEKIATTLRSMTRFVSPETVRDVAEQLARQHRPFVRKQPAASPETTYTRAAPAHTSPALTQSLTTQDSRAIADSSGSAEREVTPCCKACGNTQGRILYGKYGYYFKCAACNTNTAIRFACQPGHNPRLRKEREKFYRECAECGTSALYFTNPL